MRNIPINNAEEGNDGTVYAKYGSGRFLQHLGNVQISKNKIKEAAVITTAWLFAMALVYIVILKIRILSR